MCEVPDRERETLMVSERECNLKQQALVETEKRSYPAGNSIEDSVEKEEHL